MEYSKRKARYVACGCIRPKEDAFEDRLVYMFDEMTRLIGEYAPDEGAIETTFFRQGRHRGGQAGPSERRPDHRHAQSRLAHCSLCADDG